MSRHKSLFESTTVNLSILLYMDNTYPLAQKNYNMSAHLKFLFHAKL